MTGWQRLKMVLSVIYWAVAAFLAWDVGQSDQSSTGSFDWHWVWTILGVAAVPYAIAAAIWWAFAGFGRRQ